MSCRLEELLGLAVGLQRALQITPTPQDGAASTGGAADLAHVAQLGVDAASFFVPLERLVELATDTRQVASQFQRVCLRSRPW